MNEDDDIPDETKRSRHKDMLKMYYGNGNKSTSDKNDILDIDSSNFNSEMYLQKLKHEKSLSELMDCENEMAKQIRTLDSEMQTLVYENYNKFISATDTIRTMKRDFRQMEDQMEKLTNNMAAITELNSNINLSMMANREKIEKLSSVHSVLQKLQFLFELPARLQKCLDMGAYAAAVSYYVKTKSVLHRYREMESFSGINLDCNNIIGKIIKRLKEAFHNKESSTEQLSDCVDLLLKLEEPADVLCDEYLEHSRKKLEDNLEGLKLFLSTDCTSEKSVNVLEFVDYGCNGFLSNLALTIASYGKLFLQDEQNFARSSKEFQNDGNEIKIIASNKLEIFVEQLLDAYFKLVEERLMEDKRIQDNSLMVRALDRFYRRLQATKNLLPESNMMYSGKDIVIRVIKARCKHFNLSLKEYLSDCLDDIRTAIEPVSGVNKSLDLLELINVASSSLLNQVKSTLADIQLFTISDNNFSNIKYFQREFSCKDVREDIIVDFILHISKVMTDLCESREVKQVPEFILLMSRFCRDFQQSTVEYILTLTDEQFHITTKNKKTSITDLTVKLGATAQKLLNCYVRTCGNVISRMIRASVETRDWLNSAEPRQVRAVMRRVVEDVTRTDQLVGSLYEEGMRKARSSDSSRKTYPYQTSVSRQRDRPHWGTYAPSSHMDNSLLSNIQKLFSEKVDIFSPVQFSRTSIMTGVVKLVLKTFIECVRLKTLGTFSLQQIQVDCYYLQLYLWRFVSDEKIVHTLLDEVVASCVNRCVEPVLMEASVIEVICERG